MFEDADGTYGHGRPAVFLDRDGVLNVDHGFVSTPERWEWVCDAPAAVAELNALGYLVVVATNQSGIGRGHFSENDFAGITAWMRERLADHGATLDAVYHCPHHPTEAIGAYRRDCECRKPRPGMLLAAIADLGIDASASYLIGDSGRDIEAAEAAGVTGLHFEGGSLLAFVRENVPRPPL